MSLLSQLCRPAATDEFVQLGRTKFLARYGFRSVRPEDRYGLRFEGHRHRSN